MLQRVLLLFAASLLASSCSTPSASAPPTPHAEPSEPTALPRLWAEPLPPLLDRDRFEFSDGTATLWLGPRSTQDAPFPTDAEAVAFLRSWLKEHFGPMPEETDLVVDRIHHSADGGDGPSEDLTPGHTVVFAQTWRGIRTDRATVLYLMGRSSVDGSIALARFTPVEGTERELLTPAAAHLAVARVLSALGQGHQPASRVRRTLQFLYDWRPNSGERDQLRPVWLLDDGPFLIDAHTGEPGRNG
jgi:hypothetical protein